MAIRQYFRWRVIELLTSLLVVLPGVAVSAQDAASVLQLNIEYRTARNSRVPSPEVARKVDALEVLARNATTDERYGEAHRFLTQAITLLSGQRWTAFREQDAALKVSADRVILEPGTTVSLMLTRIFEPEQPLQGRLSGLVAIGETIGNRYRTLRELVTLDDDPDWFAPGRKITLTVPDLPDGEYQLAVSYLPNHNEPPEMESIFKTITVRISRGIYQRVGELAAELTLLRQRSNSPLRPEAASAVAEIEYTIELLGLLNGGKVPVARNNPARAARQAMELLEDVRAGRPPLATRRGDIHLAYRAETDGQLQPYRIFVPSGYHPARQWPLAIALHGWGGDENSLFEGRQNGELKRVAEERGYLVACPKGGGPTSLYLGNGERDVLAVIRQMQRDYQVDADRIYLLGHSMGGYGTWSIAVNHPEIFAAIAPVSGLGSILIQARLKNLRHIPWLVTHGVKDLTVSIEESRRMVAAGRRLGIEIRFDEVAAGDHFNVFGPALRGIFAWFDDHPRTRTRNGPR